MSKGELNLTEPCITPQRATGQILTMVGTAVRDAPSGGGGELAFLEGDKLS